MAPEEKSDALVFGQAFEDLLDMEAEEWSRHYAEKPRDVDLRTKEGKAWKAGVGDRLVLSSFEVLQMREMAEVVRDHEVFAAARSALAGQSTLIAPGTPGLQTRPDYLLPEGAAFSGFRPATIDLKTCAELLTERAVLTYGYDVQAGIARMCLDANGLRDSVQMLLAVEKQAPHRVCLFELSEEFVQLGVRKAQRAIAQIERCYQTGVWPLCEPMVVMKPPAWALDEAS